MTSGQRIKQLRIQKKLSQTDLATALGFKKSIVITEWESDSHLPNGRELRDLAYFFGVSIDYLLGLEHFISRKNQN